MATPAPAQQWSEAVWTLISLAVSLASLAVAIASVFIAQHTLRQAESVADRDQRNWRQRTWFDLYLKASEAYDFFDHFQKKYPSPPVHLNFDYVPDWNQLMALMRQTHAMAAVFPKNWVIDELFASTAVFANQQEALSPDRKLKVFNAVQNLRDQSILDVNILGLSRSPSAAGEARSIEVTFDPEGGYSMTMNPDDPQKPPKEPDPPAPDPLRKGG